MVEFTYQILDDDTIAIMKYKGDEEEVTIPDTAWGRPVTVLYDDLFKGHSELTKVNLPDSITNIGGFVFDGCDKLKTVILPKGLQEMWQYAFEGTEDYLSRYSAAASSSSKFQAR